MGQQGPRPYACPLRSRPVPRVPINLEEETMRSGELDHVKTDILVIGCGVAGSAAALAAATDRSLHVTVVTGAKDPQETNTYYAQGGIIGQGPGDSPELLSKDLHLSLIHI